MPTIGEGPLKQACKKVDELQVLIYDFWDEKKQTEKNIRDINKVAFDVCYHLEMFTKARKKAQTRAKLRILERELNNVANS